MQQIHNIYLQMTSYISNNIRTLYELYKLIYEWQACDTITIETNSATDTYINNYVDELHERLQSNNSMKKNKTTWTFKKGRQNIFVAIKF